MDDMAQVDFTVHIQVSVVGSEIGKVDEEGSSVDDFAMVADADGDELVSAAVRIDEFDAIPGPCKIHGSLL